ncbi:MAG: lysoplasmalogenase [Bacteroidetes bacterium]|jgi:uncharacterized membrane protein YhhN|nr:lysoplasmalogenase [Bacteroidota bacterium]
MKQKPLLFVVISIIHLIGQLVANDWIVWFTRPLLMPALLWWFISQINKPYTFVQKRIISALVLATAGDTTAMLASFSEWFFLADLIFYFFMNAMYVMIFLSIINFQKVSRYYLISAIIFFILYGIILLNYLGPHLGWLTIPVLLYASIVTLSIITSALTMSKLAIPAFLTLITGTLLYLTSDTLIATNKFVSPIPFSGFWGLLTYILAQYLIVKVMSEYREEAE